jgi:hypothetical protein
MTSILGSEQMRLTASMVVLGSLVQFSPGQRGSTCGKSWFLLEVCKNRPRFIFFAFFPLLGKDRVEQVLCWALLPQSLAINACLVGDDVWDFSDSHVWIRHGFLDWAIAVLVQPDSSNCIHDAIQLVFRYHLRFENYSTYLSQRFWSYFSVF